MIRKTEMTSQSGVFILWLLLLGNSACSKPVEIPSRSMPVLHSYSGISEETQQTNPILSDLLISEAGKITTLERDSGRVAVFSQSGKEERSFLFNFPQKRPVEAVALHEHDGLFSVLDLKNALLNQWSSDGRLLRQNPIIPAAISRAVSFTEKGDFFISAEGVRTKNYILHYDKSGNLRDTLGTNQSPPLQRDTGTSLSQQIVAGDIPAAFNDSVLLAATQNRLYALHRSRPVLKCFHEGRLLFEKNLALPELAEIRQAITLRNRLLEAENHYIPLSYWNDFTIDRDGHIYILLALQKKAVVYHLDQHGTILRRLTGQAGKAHLIAIQNHTLAIGDALSGKITLYRI